MLGLWGSGWGDEMKERKENEKDEREKKIKE